MKNSNRINIIVIEKIVELVIKIIYYFLTRFFTTLIKHFYFFNFNLFNSSKISFYKQKTKHFKLKEINSNISNLIRYNRKFIETVEILIEIVFNVE